MRLPLPQVVAPVGSAGGAVSAMQQQNALLQSMYQNQIARQQAKNAPANQLALTQQNQGAAQQALAGGQYALPVAQANALNAQLQPASTQANINLAGAETQNIGNTAQQVAANAAVNRAQTAANTYRLTNPNATAAQIMSVFHQSLQSEFAAMTSNLNAATQTAPSSVPAPQSVQEPTAAPSGTVNYNGKVYAYTKTRPGPNGTTQVFIPALKGWGQ